MSIIDFHSHILPGIDDGARNLDTSMAMLEQIREQKSRLHGSNSAFLCVKGQDRFFP